jgi:hypothetical protein
VDLGTWIFVVGILMFVLGALGLWTAMQKGRSTTEGFVLGLIFGPLGVILEGLLPTLEPSENVSVGAEPTNFQPATIPDEPEDVLQAIQQAKARRAPQSKPPITQTRKPTE